MITAIHNVNASSRVFAIGTYNNVENYNAGKATNVKTTDKGVNEKYQTDGSRRDNNSNIANDLTAFENLLQLLQQEISEIQEQSLDDESYNLTNSGLLNISSQSLNFLNGSGETVYSDGNAFDNNGFIPL